MTEKEKILQVLYRFEEGGLVSSDLNQVLSCVSDTIIGIGIGEQGFVTSKKDIIQVIVDGVKEPDEISYKLNYERIELRILKEDVAVLCAEIIIMAEGPEKVSRSRFSQSLTFLKEGGEWKICSLHASAPVITEENIEAYPLKFADETLNSLREKIGEEVYAAEEQYRMAVLLDTIAFYIVNFTTDTYEKCQLNSDLCAYAKPGSRYEQFAQDRISEYVVEEDRALYLESFSLKNIFRAFEKQEQEVKCEYRMLTGHGGAYIWVVTIIRLITDIVTGEKKGIMYVKNIDQRVAMQKQAEHDSMLKIYNRTAFISRVDRLLEQGKGVFMMLDIDDFKTINDTMGHPYGDKVLIKMAEVLKDSFTEETVLGRLGGDEFGIFLPEESDGERMQEYLKTLFLHMENFNSEEEEKIPVTCSVGIAVSRENKKFRELYQEADEALYCSKHNGKNGYSFYEDMVSV